MAGSSPFTVVTIFLSQNSLNSVKTFRKNSIDKTILKHSNRLQIRWHCHSGKNSFVNRTRQLLVNCLCSESVNLECDGITLKERDGRSRDVSEHSTMVAVLLLSKPYNRTLGAH